MNTSSLLLVLFIIYMPLLMTVKIRDRKANRRKIELDHIKDIEDLHLKHAEKMKLIEFMDRANLETEFEKVDKEIEELQRKALD